MLGVVTCRQSSSRSMQVAKLVVAAGIGNRLRKRHEACADFSFKFLRGKGCSDQNPLTPCCSDVPARGGTQATACRFSAVMPTLSFCQP